MQHYRPDRQRNLLPTSRVTRLSSGVKRSAKKDNKLDCSTVGGIGWAIGTVVRPILRAIVGRSILTAVVEGGTVEA